MNLISGGFFLVVLLLTLFLTMTGIGIGIGSASASGSATKVSTMCRTCESFVGNFEKGLQRTLRGNYGGGNTAWEDRKLGNWATSETRFEEIMDNICDKESEKMDCSFMIEKHEDSLLEWYKNINKNKEQHQQQQNKNQAENANANAMRLAFCVAIGEYCCPRGHVGPECLPCAGLDKDRMTVCGGNGECQGDGQKEAKEAGRDDGNGENTGKCKCNRGYAGATCMQCDTRFYEQKEKENSIQQKQTKKAPLRCAECNDSCEKCSGPGPNECLECRDGFHLNGETKLCDDVNECEEKEVICHDSESCENTRGSYKCNKKKEKEEADKQQEQQVNQESSTASEIKTEL
jgi:hypothetical protein